MIAPAWLLLSLFPLLGCLLSVRFLLRKWRYRWTAWLWGLTFCIQLLFFFGQEVGNQLIAFTWDPFEAWADVWHKTPGTALLLLLLPSVPAFLAWRIQHRHLTRATKPAAPVGGPHHIRWFLRVSASLDLVVAQRMSTVPMTAYA
jgi:hypothetical protein